MRRFALLTIVALCVGLPLSSLRADESLDVSSPDGNLKISFALKENPPPYAAGQRAYYRVSFKGTTVLADSPLGLTLSSDGLLDRDFEVAKVDRIAEKASWENHLGAKRSVPDHYNQLTVLLRQRHAPRRHLAIVFRAYNEGAAFRYVVPEQEGLKEFRLLSEDTGFCFGGEASAFALNMGRFNTHNEGEYPRTPLSTIKPESIINLPLLVETASGGPWIAILEADLSDYAGMYVGGGQGMANALRVKLSPTPGRKDKETVISATPKSTPWRVLLVGSTAGSLVEHNHLLLNLNPPCALGDTSWIQPGKAAWDWWSGSYAKNVNFEPGMNTATMKHYIDFAAKHHLEYMLVDAGWCPSGKEERSEDILAYRPEVNIPEIIAYGKQKGVKTLLWVDWLPLSKKMDEAFALYEKWGAAGVKIDYMNRDDQEMVNFYERCVRKAAEHRLTVDFHGAYKGTGLQRTYPNLLTREGVMGMEYGKWCDRVTPEYDVTIPFTRMLAGPMDFTPGAFNNAARGKFKAQSTAPMSQGTRCHQLAMYVVYESPLVMVSDYPEAYENEPGIEFIEKVPTTWDDTKVLSGEPAKFVVIARRHGNKWYIGAMTNWDARDIEIPLDFLRRGSHEARIFADGADADKVGTSVSISTKSVTAGEMLKLHLAPGGGAAAILSPTDTGERLESSHRARRRGHGGR
jgi:alpha-glucosidase